MGGSRLLARWNIFMQLDTHYTHYTHKRTQTQSTVHPSVRRRATEVASQHCERVGGGLLAVPTCNSLCITVSAFVHMCIFARARKQSRAARVACNQSHATRDALFRALRPRVPPHHVPLIVNIALASGHSCDDVQRFSPRSRPLLTDRSPAYCCEKEKIHVRLHT